MRRIFKLSILLSLSFVVLWLGWLDKPSPVLAGPPVPIVVTIAQPDGVTTFQARTWGDEYQNGTETVGGYTILQNTNTETWFYAVVDSGTGRLQLTNKVVGRDSPPASALGARPSPPPTLRTQEAFVPLGPINVSSVPTLVLLAGFTNQGSISPTVSTEANWANIFFGATSSVQDYYQEVSYNQFTVTPANETCGTANNGVTNWLNVSATHPNTATLGMWNRNITRNALQAANNCVDYATYDANNDNQITPNELLVIVIVAGYEASYGGASAALQPHVWAHQWNTTTPSLDGVTSFSYGQFGEWHATTSDNPGHQATIGVMVHELGHLLGWPDLYDIDDSSDGVGRWSVMGSGSWLGTPHGDTPAHPSGWEKWYQGWLTPRHLTDNTDNLSIPRVEDNKNNSVIQLLSNLNQIDWSFEEHSGNGEYFLIENRQRVGYDASLPGCGLLIWHIDETRASSNSANANENRRLVSLEEADGLSHLDNPSDNNQGDAGDPFPGSSNITTFNATTMPNSDFYNGTPSNASIKSISPNCAQTMTATFSNITVYVDVGAVGFEDGSLNNPFNTVNEGANTVIPDGTINILPGVYPETISINRAMKLRSTGGTVTIGTP